MSFDSGHPLAFKFMMMEVESLLKNEYTSHFKSRLLHSRGVVFEANSQLDVPAVVSRRERRKGCCELPHVRSPVELSAVGSAVATTEVQFLARAAGHKLLDTQGCACRRAIREALEDRTEFGIGYVENRELLSNLMGFLS